MVVVRQTCGDLQDLFGTDAVLELIGEGQDQQNTRRLIGGIDGEYVPTDALGLPGFVQEAIMFCF